MESQIIPSGYFSPFLDEIDPVPQGPTYVDADSPFYSHYPVHNPMAIGDVSYEEIDRFSSLEDMSDFVPTNIRVVSEEDFKAYAASLTRIHNALGDQHPHAVIFPLRGGLKPGIQLEVMADHTFLPLWLPFTAGGAGRHKEAITAALEDALACIDVDGQICLSVVDTAISGHSASKLVEYLLDWSACHTDRPIRCFFNLLYDPSHPHHPQPRKAIDLPERSTDHVTLELQLYKVPSLLVEDWSEALGWEVEYEGSSSLVKPSVRAGEGLLKRPDGTVSFFSSESLSTFIDASIASAITEKILTDPKLLWQRDVWQGYTER